MPTAQRGGRDVLADAHDRGDARYPIAQQPLPLGVECGELGERVGGLPLVGPRDPLPRAGVSCSFEPTHQVSVRSRREDVDSVSENESSTVKWFAPVAFWCQRAGTGVPVVRIGGLINYRALMFRMTVQDVFSIKGRGTVATGRVEYGQLSVGDQVRINDGPPVRVDAIEAFRKKLDTAATGDNIGILFRKLDKSEVAAGDVLTSGGVYLA